MTLGSTAPTLDWVTDVEMDSLVAATRQRSLMENTDSSDHVPAEKCWRADHFVAKASMDELTGSWLVDENGEVDEGAATDTWCGGGALRFKQVELEVTEGAGQSARVRSGRGHETRGCGQLQNPVDTMG